MGTTTRTLYDTDFVEWAAHTAELVRAGRFDEIDLENLAEEIEDLARSNRSAVRSHLRRMLVHLITRRIQPDGAGKSWRASFVESRAEIEYKIEDSPSLRRELEDNLQRIYRRAVRQVLDGSGLTAQEKALNIPKDCPYIVAELIETDLDSLTRR